MTVQKGETCAYRHPGIEQRACLGRAKRGPTTLNETTMVHRKACMPSEASTPLFSGRLLSIQARYGRLEGNTARRHPAASFASSHAQPRPTSWQPGPLGPPLCKQHDGEGTAPSAVVAPPAQPWLHPPLHRPQVTVTCTRFIRSSFCDKALSYDMFFFIFGGEVQLRSITNTREKGRLKCEGWEPAFIPAQTRARRAGRTQQSRAAKAKLSVRLVSQGSARGTFTTISFTLVLCCIGSPSSLASLHTGILKPLVHSQRRKTTVEFAEVCWHPMHLTR